MSIFKRDTPRFRVKTQRIIEHSPLKIIERYLLEKEKEKEENKENSQQHGFFVSEFGGKGSKPESKPTRKPTDNLPNYKNKHENRYFHEAGKIKGKSEKSFASLNKIARDSLETSLNSLSAITKNESYLTSLSRNINSLRRNLEKNNHKFDRIFYKRLYSKCSLLPNTSPPKYKFKNYRL